LLEYSGAVSVEGGALQYKGMGKLLLFGDSRSRMFFVIS
jgi:hypothetical protein